MCSVSAAKTPQAAPSHPAPRRQGPPIHPAHHGDGGIGCERLRGSLEPPASVTRTQGQPPRTGSWHHEPNQRLRPEQQMANPAETSRQQEKGPQGVPIEARDLKGNSPRIPEPPQAAPSFPVGRDMNLPGVLQKVNLKTSGAGDPVGTHPTRLRNRERDGGFYTRLGPSGAAGIGRGTELWAHNPMPARCRGPEAVFMQPVPTIVWKCFLSVSPAQGSRDANGACD